MFKEVIKYFRQISRIPRGSGNEKGISDYLVTFAKTHGLSYIQDKNLNIIIKRPAAEECKEKDPVILQAHMDMVCEKTEDSLKDLSKDPVDLIFFKKTKDGKQKTVDPDDPDAVSKALSENNLFLTADRTTLGGDDGIGVAIALALLSDKELSAPPIEFVCTVSEETGMIGASKIDLSELQGKKLINLDSDDEGYFMLGCAGGGLVKVSHPAERTFPDTEPDDLEALRITLEGLTGGHSGSCAASGRANAIYELFKVLKDVISSVRFRLLYLTGGGKDNAIPRSAEAHIVFRRENKDKITDIVTKDAKELKEKYKETDPDLDLHYTEEAYEVHLDAKVGGNLLNARLITDKGKETPVPEEVLTPILYENTRDFISLVLALPNGLISMMKSDDPMMKDLPETSLNLGIIELARDKFSLGYLVRSQSEKGYSSLTAQMKEIAKSAGASYSVSGEYPAWEYTGETEFYRELAALYEKMYGKKPIPVVIHAGVECGLMIDRISGCEAVSIGPDMNDIHTTEETLDISSSERVYDFVRAYLSGGEELS
ncbi:MAG: M20/M25/M40 family metallo-hydrolase [Lachnospiraceae bacterium]|nr:M20/M25/M40 family metallo-hydrolase [Lachnospiraceae bacterium]